jgi:hypothetical protein
MAEAVAGLGDPELVIENDSDVNFTIVLNGAQSSTLEVPPHQKRSVRLKPGTYSYSGGAPDIIPVEGNETFAGDMRYSWRFFVKMIGPDDPAFVGKGWSCFEVSAKPDFMMCGRSMSACQKAQASLQKPGDPPTKPCAEHKIVYGFSDTVENLLIYGPTMEQCEVIRKEYLKEAKDAAKVTPCVEKP